MNKIKEMKDNNHQIKREIQQRASGMLYQFTQTETLDWRIAVVKEMLRRLEFEKTQPKNKEI